MFSQVVTQAGSINEIAAGDGFSCFYQLFFRPFEAPLVILLPPKPNDLKSPI